MNFVTGITLPQINTKDAQPMDIVEEQLKYIMSQAGEGILHEVMEDYFLMESKRLRARLCIDSAKVLGIRAKDISPWAVACELMSNCARVKEALVFAQMGSTSFSREELRNHFEGECAADSFMALLPTIVGQLPINDGLRTRLLCTISNFYLAYTRELLELSQLENGLPTDVVLSKVKPYISARASFLFELPVQGTSIVAGLSLKESLRMGEPFKSLGELQYFIDEAMILIEGPNKLLAEHTLTPINLLLMAKPMGQVNRDELVKGLLDSGVLKEHMEQIKSISHAIDKSDALKPWPKMLDVLRGYNLTFMRAIDSTIKMCN